MVDAVGHPCQGVLHGHREGIGGVNETHSGEDERREVWQLVVGFCARDDAAHVVFAACGCHRDDVNDGHCRCGRLEAAHEVPSLFHMVIHLTLERACHSGYGFGAVEHRTSAY